VKLSIIALSVMALLGAAAVQVRADSQAGDDLVVCCDVPAAGASQAACGFFSSCVAIDGSPASINKCSGIVVGCAEGAFACQPSATSGKKDCSCANIAAPCAAQK